jgi:hypothetical protein
LDAFAAGAAAAAAFPVVVVVVSASVMADVGGEGKRDRRRTRGKDKARRIRKEHIMYQILISPIPLFAMAMRMTTGPYLCRLPFQLLRQKLIDAHSHIGDYADPIHSTPVTCLSHISN